MIIRVDQKILRQNNVTTSENKHIQLYPGYRDKLHTSIKIWRVDIDFIRQPLTTTPATNTEMQADWNYFTPPHDQREQIAQVQME